MQPTYRSASFSSTWNIVSCHFYLSCGMNLKRYMATDFQHWTYKTLLTLKRDLSDQHGFKWAEALEIHNSHIGFYHLCSTNLPQKTAGYYKWKAAMNHVKFWPIMGLSQSCHSNQCFPGKNTPKLYSKWPAETWWTDHKHTLTWLGEPIPNILRPVTHFEESITIVPNLSLGVKLFVVMKDLHESQGSNSDSW